MFLVPEATNGSGNQKNVDVRVGSGSGSWSGCGNYQYYHAGQDMSVKHYHHYHIMMNGFATEPPRDVQPNARLEFLVSKQISGKLLDDMSLGGVWYDENR